MAAVHEHTLRTTYPPSHVQLACNGTYLALPHGRTNVAVWSLQDITCKPLELEGHRQTVSAQVFGHRESPTLLVSCAKDYVIVWNVDKARACYETGQQIRGQVVGTTLGYVRYCAFSWDDQRVALCIDREVLIVDAKEERLDTTLEGHHSTVNCAEFCPHYSATLVSAADDRTFKVWDLDNSVLMYQSTIISSSPFISLTMNPLMESFALGSADGMVRVYDLTDGNGFRCLHQLDIQKLSNKVKASRSFHRLSGAGQPEEKGPTKISSKPSWQRSEGRLNTEEPASDPEEDSEAGTSILGLLYTYKRGTAKPQTPSNLTFLQQDDTIVSELLENSPMLVVSTTAAVIQVNARTLEPCSFVSLQDPVESCSMLEGTDKVVSLAGSVAMAQGMLGPLEQVWCVVGSLFLHEVSILRLYQPTEDDQSRLRLQLATTHISMPDNLSNLSTDGATETEPELTVLSSAPMNENSPLKSELIMKPKDTPTSKRTVKGSPAMRRPGSRADSDQSLTFHDKVKSSGYSAAPRRTMFQPKTSFKGAKASAGKSSKISKPVVREYPVNSDAPTHVKVKLDVADRPTAINTVVFSSDGQQLACALANTSAQVFKMPLTGKGCAFTGHNGSVTSVRWSRDDKWLITSCDDKTASVWSLGLSDPVMTMSFVNNNFGADKEGGLKPTKDNPLFGKPVKFGQFYYMDKFILLTVGNAFHLYKYHLDTSKSDIKRYLSNNRYKMVESFQMEQAQQITAFSAVNGFYSYIALTAGSNKSLEVFDLNKGQSARVIVDAHARPIHTICQNEGSAYVSHPSSAYDLFVTASAGDCIKLWDLRSNRCVHRYDGHSDRVYPCGVAISPCSRFIATGSEDRSAYIFDIRSGTYLHKLLGHTDTVGDVTFHPLHPLLLTASLEGKIRLFADH